MESVTSNDSERAAVIVRNALINASGIPGIPGIPKILIVGPRGCGKTWVCDKACKDMPFLRWDISSGPPTMVGSSGLSRFFHTSVDIDLRNESPNGRREPDKRLKETIIIDDVDSSLIAEGSVRSPGVSALLAIVTDPMRPVILTSTSEDPFKLLGTSAAGRAIKASITLFVRIAEGSVEGNAEGNAKVVRPRTRRNAKKCERDTLYVLMLEAAAGYHSNDALSSIAASMRQTLLSPSTE